MFMGKLDLLDEVIVGGEKMRSADDTVCYSTAMSDYVKELKFIDDSDTLQENRPVQHVQRSDCVQYKDQCM